MKWTSKFRPYELDLNAYKIAVTSHLEDRIKEGAKLWLNVTVATLIPSWSNASKATFEELARAVGVSINYGPQLSRLDRRPLGLSTGTGGYEAYDAVASFWYTSTLRYLAFNDQNVATPGPPPRPFTNLTHPTPYNFTDIGFKAFQEFAKTVKLPNPFNYMRKI
jgi:hypothetical protein